MQRVICIAWLFFGVHFLNAQDIDSDLLMIKERLDSIASFEADIELNIDVSFINMPTKYAKMNYKRGKPIDFKSDDFVMLPKRGLDLSMQELFKYPFITVDRGIEEIDGLILKKINIIPNDKRADFAIATLWLNTTDKRVKVSEISTKKNGAYTISMDYATTESILPDKLIVEFEIEKIKLPIQYLAKNIDVDKKEMRQQEVKTGKIILNISNYHINKI